MDSVELYRTLEASRPRDRLARGRLPPTRLVGRADAGASPPGRLREAFGLPLELISAEEAQRALPADVHRRRARRGLPSDRRLHRPGPAHVRAHRGRPTARRGDQHEHAGHRDRARGRPRVRRRNDKGSIETGVVVDAGAIFAGEIGAPSGHEHADHPDGSRVPDHAERGSRSKRTHDAPTPHSSSTSARMSSSLVIGSCQRNTQAPWGAGPRAEGLRRQAACRGLGALRGADGRTRSCRVPELEDAEVDQARQRARGLHARRRVHPRPVRRARLLGRGRLLRPRARRRGRRWDSSSPSGSSRAVPALDVWEMDSRRFGRHYREPRVHARPHDRDLLDVLRRQVPGPGAARRAAAARSRRPTRGSRSSARPSGEKSGWERANWFEPNAASGDESLRPQRLGRARSGRPRSEPSIAPAARRPRSSTRRRSPRSTSSGPAPPTSSSACATTESPATSARSRTRRCSTRAAGSSATSPSRGSPKTASGSSPARPSAITTPPGSAGTSRRTGARSVEDVTSRLACLGPLGPCRAGHPPAAHRRGPLERRVPLHARPGDRRRGRCPASRFGSPTSGSSAGSSTARWSSGSASSDAIWESGTQHGLAAGGYKAIDSLRLEKGYRVWGADITPDETPYEAGLDFAVKLDKGDFIGRDALGEASKSPPERRLACLVLSDPRSVALGSEPVRVEARPSAALRAAALATASSARLPTPTCRAARSSRPGRRGRNLRGLGRRRGRRRAALGSRAATGFGARAGARRRAAVAGRVEHARRERRVERADPEVAAHDGGRRSVTCERLADAPRWLGPTLEMPERAVVLELCHVVDEEEPGGRHRFGAEVEVEVDREAQRAPAEPAGGRGATRGSPRSGLR